MISSLRDAIIPVCGTIVVIAVICLVLFSRDLKWRRKRSAHDTNPNASLAFKNFYRIYTDAIMGHIIFSVQSYAMVPRYLDEMSPQERANAEALMIRALPNSFASYGLGYLRSQKAVPHLRSLQRSVHGPE